MKTVLLFYNALIQAYIHSFIWVGLLPHDYRDYPRIPQSGCLHSFPMRYFMLTSIMEVLIENRKTETYTRYTCGAGVCAGVVVNHIKEMLYGRS